MNTALAAFQAASLSWPYKLALMAAHYIEACQRGDRDPAALLRTGAALLNNTFKLADKGCAETLGAMKRDGINAVSLAMAADMFTATADLIDDERKGPSKAEGEQNSHPEEK